MKTDGRAAAMQRWGCHLFGAGWRLSSIHLLGFVLALYRRDHVLKPADLEPSDYLNRGAPVKAGLSG